MFKVGQVVWDLIDGKGVVTELEDHPQYPVRVTFDSGGYEDYTHDGRKYEDDKVRSLYFSEPKIEAATEPVFNPVLKKGDWVVLSDNTAQAIVKVVSETDTELFYEGNGAVTFVNKDVVDVYRLGGKIEFN